MTEEDGINSDMYLVAGTEAETMENVTYWPAQLPFFNNPRTHV